MSLTIKVVYPRNSRVYYGGDEVTGVLEIKGPLDISDGTVKILFRGYAETLLPVRNDTLIDRQIFFQTSQTIFQGAVNLKEDEIQTLYFKFLLPIETEPSWGQPSVKYRKKKDLFAQGPHPIPPSAALSSRWTNYWTAQILYSLYAEVKGRRTGWLTVNGLIIVVPSPAQVQHTLQNANIGYGTQSTALTYVPPRPLEDNKGKRRSIKTWFGDKFASGRPQAIFNFTAHTATTLMAGQGIPIRIALNYDSSKSNLPFMPEFRLLEVKYELKAITNTAHRNELGPDIYRKERATVFERRIPFLQMPLTDGQVLDIGVFDPGQATSHYISLDVAVISPFVTYNVSRRYQSKIEIVFRCDTKEMIAKLKWDGVNIVFNETYHEQPATKFVPTGATSSRIPDIIEAVGVVAMVVAPIAGILGAG